MTATKHSGQIKIYRALTFMDNLLTVTAADYPARTLQFLNIYQGNKGISRQEIDFESDIQKTGK